MRQTDESSANNCLINCTVASDASVGEGTVVEFSVLGSKSSVGKGCLVSNVRVPVNHLTGHDIACNESRDIACDEFCVSLILSEWRCDS